MNFVAILPVFFAAFLSIFYFFEPFFREVDTVFISMTIFLFSTLAGFFISQQSARYRNIVTNVNDFDGTLSYFYRASSVFGNEFQSKIALLLKKHYEKIIAQRDWDTYLSQKTTTLTDLTNLIDDVTTKDALNGGQSAFASRAYFGLGDLQKIRKRLISLYNARIPSFQWYLMDFLSLILIVVVASIPSTGIFFAALVKAAFGTVIIAVMILLRKINNLMLFEDMAGKTSAKDVLDIIANKK